MYTSSNLKKYIKLFDTCQEWSKTNVVTTIKRNSCPRHWLWSKHKGTIDLNLHRNSRVLASTPRRVPRSSGCRRNPTPYIFSDSPRKIHTKNTLYSECQDLHHGFCTKVSRFARAVISVKGCWMRKISSSLLQRGNPYFWELVSYLLLAGRLKLDGTIIYTFKRQNIFKIIFKINFERFFKLWKF